MVARAWPAALIPRLRRSYRAAHRGAAHARHATALPGCCAASLQPMRFPALAARARGGRAKGLCPSRRQGCAPSAPIGEASPGFAAPRLQPAFGALRVGDPPPRRSPVPLLSPDLAGQAEVRAAHPCGQRKKCSQNENFSLAPKMRTGYILTMRIIAVSTLKEFWSQPGRGDAEQPLRAWVQIVAAADWSKPTDVKRMFGSADIMQGERVIFDIGGNKYRLIAAVHYRGKRVYVRFIGTHKEYDNIDPATV
jgi:mRNA interferase HigB